jgi:hypothetical protein
MAEELDFEQAWLAKFAGGLDAIAGEGIRREVMRGSDSLSARSSQRDVITWTKTAIHDGRRGEAQNDHELHTRRSQCSQPIPVHCDRSPPWQP